MPAKFYLDIDDTGFLLPGLEDILAVKKHYKDFKITAFTIPFPAPFFMRENQKQFTKEKYKRWAEIINSYDWMEVAIHGFSHTKAEFDCTYEKANLILKATENLFKEIGLKYVKIFKAPYWQYSYDSLNALKDRGYTVAINRDFPISIPDGLRTYKYNWSYEEPLPNKAMVIKGHGHTTGKGVKNAMGKCYYNITKQIPDNAKFGFVSEYEEN